MKAQDIMTKHPAVCSMEDTIMEAARLMAEHDCGAIPVVESMKSKKLVGIITDRDVACRVTAEGYSPEDSWVEDFMTESVITVKPQTTIEECCHIMKDKQLRRLVAVDEDGNCCGIICQAQIAKSISPEETGEVVQAISRSHRHAGVA